MARRKALDKLDPTVARLVNGRSRKKRSGRQGGLKAEWEQTNIRLAPEVKQRLRTWALAWQVPLEEVVHVALLHYVDGLDSHEIEEPGMREAVTRKTVL